MPAIFDQLQKMEERRIDRLSDRLADYADAEKQVQSNIVVCLDNITSTAKAVNSGNDMQIVIDDMKTGYSPPGDMPFEEYGKPVATKGKKAASGGIFKKQQKVSTGIPLSRCRLMLATTKLWR
jgi:hypothetical protein